MNNPFGPEHADLMWWLLNGALFIAAFFFFLWIKEKFSGLIKGINQILSTCGVRGKECPVTFRTKMEAQRDWQNLNGSLKDLKLEIGELRKEFKDHKDDFWEAFNHHGHADGKVTR